MATSDNPLQRSAVTVAARDTGDRFIAPRTNPALQLAGALADFAPEANKAMQNYAKIESAKQATQAKKDAIETNGAELADAVRDGKIEATQNPWYVQAYKREGAAVRAQSELGQLQVAAQSWEEQSDPAAFSKRWGEEVGKLAGTYEGADAGAGFTSVAGQYTQQTLAANQAKAVASIKAERLDNLSSLTASSISDAIRASGGDLSPGALAPSIQAAKAQWFGTGGDAAGWNKIIAGAVTTAAYSTKTPGAIDLLKDPSLSADGKATIYAMTGVADAAESDRYRIQQAAENEATGRLRSMQAVIKGRGFEGANVLWETYGNRLINGEVTSQQLISDLTAQNFKPAEIAAAIGQLGESVKDIAEYDTVRMKAPGGEGQETLLALGMQANQGWSPALEAKVSALVANGTIQASSGQAILNRSISRSDHFDSENRQDARAAASDARAARRDQAGQTLQQAKTHRAAIGGQAGWATSKLAGLKGRAPTDDLRKRATLVATLASNDWLTRNPDDYAGATQHVHNQLVLWGNGQLQRGGKPASKPSSSSKNTRR